MLSSQVISGPKIFGMAGRPKWPKLGLGVLKLANTWTIGCFVVSSIILPSKKCTKNAHSPGRSLETFTSTWPAPFLSQAGVKKS